MMEIRVHHFKIQAATLQLEAVALVVVVVVVEGVDRLQTLLLGLSVAGR
jgi:hypothetical protein